MAILKRRKPREFWNHVKESVWPTQGWLRTFHYYRHRVFRTGDSTYKITAGLASGAAVSFTPFMGTHFAQAVFLSWLLRANLLAGFIGTAVGNPATFTFIFWLIYKVGIFICGLFGLEDFVALPVGMALDTFLESPWSFIKYLFAHPLKLLLPMTIGGYLCAFIVWFISYAILYYPIRMLRKAYRFQRMKRRKKRQKKQIEKQRDKQKEKQA